MEWLKKLLEAQGIDAEVINKIMDETKDNQYIPKSRLDEVLGQNKDLKTQLEDRDNQLKELGEKSKGNEELTKQIEELQATNKKSEEDYETKLSQQAFNFALDSALRDSKVKNVKAVKALLEVDKIKLEDNTLTGLDEQLKGLKESSDYLFEVDQPPTTGSTGNFAQHSQQSATSFTKDQVENMTPDQINENWDVISKQMEEGSLK